MDHEAVNAIMQQFFAGRSDLIARAIAGLEAARMRRWCIMRMRQEAFLSITALRLRFIHIIEEELEREREDARAHETRAGPREDSTLADAAGG